MSLQFYGIPNCDTVKKARKWLEGQGIDYVFHDYKKEGVDPARLQGWAGQVGWESLLNRSGTTFRKLPDEAKADLDEARALQVMAANPSTIRRPLVEHPGGLLVGFKLAEWEAALT